MRTSIDAAGRLVVPKRIRDALGIRGGEFVEVEERDGAIEIRIAPAEVDLVETADGPVARLRAEAPPLTDDLVRETLEQVRR